VGVFAGQAPVPHYGVAMHFHQPAGLADTAPLIQVLQE
jgi:hypothetical protein